jgi:hypothetical protein
MSNPSDQNLSDRELDWLAFRYIAGELTDGESSEFESRLATDQEACEAVSKAVELAEVTSMANRGPLVEVSLPRASNHPDWTRRVAWMVCGAAACLVLMVIAQHVESKGPAAIASGGSKTELVDGQPGAGTPEGRRLSGGSPELALAWVQARSSATAIELADASGSPADEPGLDVTGLSEITAPTWMVAALEGLSVRPDADEIQ